MELITSEKILVRVQELKKYYPVTQGVFQRQVGAIKAVDGVSFDIYRGETLGLVGESGCGKSTTGRAILQLYKPTSGSIFFDGEDLTRLNSNQMRQMRCHMQMIFQDPYSSLNPRMTIGNIIAEPLLVNRIGDPASRTDRVQELMNLVGLNPYHITRYPHEFSGGQLQRVGIARALATNPSFIVADEPISALDVSIQAQVINLLEDLKEKLRLTYLFIAHDLSMVRHISDRVAVMYLGRIIEISDRSEIYDNSLHPYTQALFSAVPIPDPDKEAQRERLILKGDIPDPANPPSGCRFHPRCPFATEQCVVEIPELRNLGSQSEPHWVACHYAEQFAH